MILFVGGFYGATAALPIFKKIADRCMGINRELLPKTMLADTQATMAGVRLAGWSEKDELNEIIDVLSLDTHVDGQGDWARLEGGEEIENGSKKYSRQEFNTGALWHGHQRCDLFIGEQRAACTIQWCGQGQVTINSFRANLSSEEQLFI
jgi:hypothetical protein